MEPLISQKCLEAFTLVIISARLHRRSHIVNDSWPEVNCLMAQVPTTAVNPQFLATVRGQE
jgi:hypothetical protein